MTSNLPTGWKVEPIGKCTQIALSNVDKKSVIDEQQVELCNYMDVYRNTKITAEIDFMVATASISQIEKFGIQRGDVMITKDSEDPKDIAVPSVVSEDFSGNVVCGYHLALLRPGTGILGDFLAWSLRSYFVNNQFTRRANGATRFGITSSVIQSTKLLLPPLPEQRKIAEILSSVDEAIGVTQAVIEQTRRVKEGLLQELLTKGIGHTRFKKTAIGEIPESWSVKRLDQISPSLSVGLVINPSTYFTDDGTVPMLVGSNIKPNGIQWSNLRHISVASNDTLSSTKVYAGDLVTVRVGSPGLTMVIPPSLDGCNCASMMIVRQNKSVDSQWLSAVMNSQQGREQFKAVQYGTAQKQFNISHAVAFRFGVPPLVEQKEIAGILFSLMTQERVREDSLTQLQKTKAGLLQDLLTGKVRVSV